MVVDKTGKKYGMLFVEKRLPRYKNNRTYYKCKCECGNETNVDGGNLKDNGELHTSSCGCNRKVKIYNWDINNIKKNIYDKYGDEFEILDKEYKNAREKMTFKHKCGYVFKTSYDNFMKNGGCKRCSGLVIEKGINDLWTTHPQIASMLIDQEIGYNVSKTSHRKFDWICPICGSLIRSKSVLTVVKNGLICTNCSDGISYPNKFICNLLDSFNEQYETEKTFNWSNGYRYDVYIKNKNLLIEMDGAFHYDKYFSIEDFNESKKRDLKKDILSETHGLKLVRIDCNYPTTKGLDNLSKRFMYIKDKIISSELINYYNLKDVDWNKIDLMSQRNIFLSVVNEYKKGKYISDISVKYHLSRDTVSRYIHRADEIGLCIYDKSRKKHNTAIKKRVIKYDLCMNKICKYESITDAANSVNLSISAISLACSGKNKTAAGYIWRYAD